MKDLSRKKYDDNNIITIYIALKPLYLWESGSIQLADLFLILSTIYLFIKRKGTFKIEKDVVNVFSLFIALCLYQIIVNTVWTIITGELLLKASIYYIFNFIAFFDCVIICKDCSYDDISKSVKRGLLIALTISSFFAVLSIGTSIRAIGLFNNPNQLGYYSLIAISLVLLFYNNHSKLDIFLLFLSIWLIVVSGSKAAFISVGILLILFIFILNKDGSKADLIKKIIAIFAFISFIYLFFFSTNDFILSNKTIMFMRMRLINFRNESDSNLSTGRGYDRLVEIGLNIIWGVGEGAFNRFETMSGMEAHSSYVTLLTSYGIIGFSIYLFIYNEMFNPE